MLIHARVPLANTDALMALCCRLGLRVVEDRAQKNGSAMEQIPSGRAALGTYGILG